MSDAILETSIVEMRSDRRLRLTRGGGRSLVAKLPPPKNRNKRERKDILTILTCGASPAEGRRGATRDSSIRGRPNLVSCDGTAPFLRHHSHSCKHGKSRHHCQVIKESSACVWATQILSVKANSSKNSNELLPILLRRLLLRDSRHGPTNYSGGRFGDKKKGATSSSRRADELILSVSLDNDRGAEDRSDRALFVSLTSDVREISPTRE